MSENTPNPCGAQDSALVPGPDGVDRHPTCNLPAGHQWHQEWRDSELQAEWSGRRVRGRDFERELEQLRADITHASEWLREPGVTGAEVWPWLLTRAGITTPPVVREGDPLCVFPNFVTGRGDLDNLETE